MAQCSALRCAFGIWQNNEKLLISNWLRFVVTCLLTAALWVLFHCSRHSFAVFALNKGLSMSVVSRLLGHGSTDITEKVYAKFLPETLSAEIAKLDGELSNLTI